jgi:L-rhamnose mutarotase
MAALDVNTRWQAEMASFFAGTTPTEGFPLLTEVFHLAEEPEEK